MAPDPVLHERIYDGLKSALRAGRMRPGHHIDLTAISDEHRASVTPVREAVCRLVGEGLAEFQRHGGFRVAGFTPDELRGLYIFNATMLAQVIQMAGDDALDRAVGAIWLPREGAEAVELAAAAATLFSSLAVAAGNSVFLRAIESASDRLAAARIAEFQIFRDLRGELLMMNHGPAGQLRRTLSRRVSTYHRRRLALSDRIAGLVSLEH